MTPSVVSVADARVLTTLGTSKIYKLINDGTLQTVKVGSRTLIKRDSIDRLLGLAA